MGLFFEVIIVGLWLYWIGRKVFESWQLRRGETSALSGEHDAGVWVNEDRWSRIVTELERGDQKENPRRGPE